MKFRYLGHSCFTVETSKTKLIFDPFISKNELASAIDVGTIDAEYVLLTHGHFDHVADAEDIAKRNDATIISNFEIVTWFGEKGCKGWPMNHGGEHEFEFGKVKYVNAVHSSMLPDGSYGGNPGGFIIEADGRRIYYAGDTALHMDMELIGRYWKPDLAFLPIGDNFTMGIEDSIRCADMIRCDAIVGMHYDTFPFIKMDHQRAVMAFKDAGKTLLLPGIGEEFDA